MKLKRLVILAIGSVLAVLTGIIFFAEPDTDKIIDDYESITQPDANAFQKLNTTKTKEQIIDDSQDTAGNTNNNKTPTVDEPSPEVDDRGGFTPF